MANKKSTIINTVIVKGDEDSFKAALTRSVLGVTFAKFKRRKGEFYQHSAHNAAITKQICNWLYEYLLSEPELRLEKSLSDFKLRVTLTLNWDETGKIIGVSDIKLCIYSEIAELAVKELELVGKPERIKVDFFFSTIDDRSINLKSELPRILGSLGMDNFDYTEYDFLNDEGRNAAKVNNVDRVPTVIIDGNPLVNPDEKKLHKELEGAFSPKIAAKGAELTFAKSAKSNIMLLSNIFKDNKKK